MSEAAIACMKCGRFIRPELFMQHNLWHLEQEARRRIEVTRKIAQEAADSNQTSGVPAKSIIRKKSADQAPGQRKRPSQSSQDASSRGTRGKDTGKNYIPEGKKYSAAAGSGSGSRTNHNEDVGTGNTEINQERIKQ
ncbi:hypothetical protein ES705_38089 [subsurface metagenome]